ncbi:S8 family serine peptidase [Alteromonas sp. 5E99-2]|uniref:S8 family peptidase n=1 Tax=Alteromonas sp. 5E99-2 TaxID=2817683 RepID=UPI001A9955FC|nr:S8 family peptidase [Alteromonas sp. 5E99-2]MBO1254929.1 S8 family serine peptidase [Alteromonas sp. 5E99-2]
MKLSKVLPLAIATLSLSAVSNVYAENTESNVKKRLIVKFAEQTEDTRSKKQKHKAREEKIANRLARKAKYLKETVSETEVFEIEDMDDSEITWALQELNGMSDVIYAEEDKLMQHYLVPNDPLYSSQWHYYQQSTSINAEDAWDKATGDGVIVAVLDTGYVAHADLVGNILPGYDMISDAFMANDGNGRDSDARDTGDGTAANECGSGSRASSSSWHGTHVSGTIAAVTDNNLGVAGVAYDAKIVPVRVLGKCGGFTSDIADGIVWASGGNVAGIPSNPNPAQVINMSLGGSGSCSQTYINAINTARNNGTTVVVAAGNSNVNASSAVPANCPGVISVAATGPTGAKASYSNFGSVVDVAAPGGDLAFGQTSGVLSTLNTGTAGPSADSYEYYQGTSMATPHVAGIAALLYELDPSITPDEVESIIVDTANSFPGNCSQCGSGIANANDAVDDILGNSSGGGSDSFTPITFSVSVPNMTTGNFTHYTLNVPEGASELDVNISGGSGDGDLYIRFGAQPTLNDWDYRPYLNGNNESVNIDDPQAGTWYISVHAFSTTSGITLSGGLE